MAQIDKVRLPDGRTVRPTEWSSTPLYSTVDIATGALTALQAFSYGRGGEVPGSVGPRKSTLCDTNMRGDGGQIQENEELLLYSIMVELFMSVRVPASYYAAGDLPDAPLVSAQNVLCFQRDTILSLRIAATKEYYSHPVGFFPAAMGVDMCMGAAVVDNANAPLSSEIIVGSNGSVASFDNREIGTPHQVAPGEAFEIALEFPFGQINSLNFGSDTSARLQARIYADGYRRRPVA